VYRQKRQAVVEAAWVCAVVLCNCRQSKGGAETTDISANACEEKYLQHAATLGKLHFGGEQWNPAPTPFIFAVGLDMHLDPAFHITTYSEG
jgi:hypothetical protein